MKETNLLKSYITGFILSLLLTFTAFLLVWIHVSSAHETIPHTILLPVIIGLAFIQLLVQLIFFLHLLKESKPRWNLVFFVATMGIIFIVVFGSMWIMQHLNYNMTPRQMEEYTQSQDGF